MSVVAEGVETAEQARFLQATGCHELQGYLLGRPMRATAIDHLVAGSGDACPGADVPPAPDAEPDLTKVGLATSPRGFPL